jgi:hypothetical protein
VTELGGVEESATIESWRPSLSEGFLTSHGAVLFAHSPKVEEDVFSEVSNEVCYHVPVA